MTTQKTMTQYTCQHCDFCATTRELFPNSENVCKNCIRDRPISWKTMIFCLARQNNAFPADLRIKPVKRAKAVNELQNLASPSAKQLMANMKFDSIIFKEWSKKKLELQRAKGGQCAYADSCLDHILEWIEDKKNSGNIVIHPTDISQCSWKDNSDTLSPWPTCISDTPYQAVSAHHATPVASSWEIKFRKQQKKNKALQRQVSELEAKIKNLTAQNNNTIIKNETMVELINHLTQQVIATTSAKANQWNLVMADH